jgi:hypothetical protein
LLLSLTLEQFDNSKLRLRADQVSLSLGGMKNFITNLLRVEKLPTPDLKYEVQCATHRADLEAAYR